MTAAEVERLRLSWLRARARTIELATAQAPAEWVREAQRDADEARQAWHDAAERDTCPSCGAAVACECIQSGDPS